ncbi:MAG: FAD-dependent oxidoreductase, partial [Myxococcota bacterium]|nr:FAD-dependent oxidoreductase [Myxococcota bacterium]
EGGYTQICADVEEIIIEKGRAVGVKLKDGTSYRSQNVVSAAGVMSTLKRLLPEDAGQAPWVGKALEGIRPAPAHICLYIGFKGDIRKANAGSANKWFWSTWNSEEREWDISDPDNLKDCPILYCSFPSLKDPLHDPGEECRHTGEVVTFVPWNAFSEWSGTKWRKRGGNYPDLKEKIEKHILDQFLRNMPELKDMVDYVELSTPLSTEYFCRPMDGSIYGIEPTPERFANPWIRPNPPVSGLYFSGSEVASVGVIGAMMGGVLAAAAAEPVNAMRFLRTHSQRKRG